MNKKKIANNNNSNNNDNHSSNSKNVLTEMLCVCAAILNISLYLALLDGLRNQLCSLAVLLLLFLLFLKPILCCFDISEFSHSSWFLFIFAHIALTKIPWNLKKKKKTQQANWLNWQCTLNGATKHKKKMAKRERTRENNHTYNMHRVFTKLFKILCVISHYVVSPSFRMKRLTHLYSFAFFMYPEKARMR